MLMINILFKTQTYKWWTWFIACGNFGYSTLCRWICSSQL